MTAIVDDGCYELRVVRPLLQCQHSISRQSPGPGFGRLSYRKSIAIPSSIDISANWRCGIRSMSKTASILNSFCCEHLFLYYLALPITMLPWRGQKYGNLLSSNLLSGVSSLRTLLCALNYNGYVNDTVWVVMILHFRFWRSSRLYRWSKINITTRVGLKLANLFIKRSDICMDSELHHIKQQERDFRQGLSV